MSTKAARPDWSGRTVVCIASGPSLTPEDCEQVRLSGHPSIVVNTSFRLAPWADVLFAWDANWWREHAKEAEIFKGRKMTGTGSARRFAEDMTEAPWFVRFLNSGACAVGLAVSGKAEKVLMLGFDCQMSGQKMHWHGDHPPKLSNAKTLRDWPKTFKKVAAFAQREGVKVVNVSRETALTCFERSELEAHL